MRSRTRMRERCEHTHTHTFTNPHSPYSHSPYSHSPYSHSPYSHSPYPHSRAQLGSRVEFLENKLERANLSKSIAEAKLSDFEREKTMIELDVKEIIARHKTEVTERMSKVARVCHVIVM